MKNRFAFASYLVASAAVALVGCGGSNAPGGDQMENGLPARGAPQFDAAAPVAPQTDSSAPVGPQADAAAPVAPQADSSAPVGPQADAAPPVGPGADASATTVVVADCALGQIGPCNGEPPRHGNYGVCRADGTCDCFSGASLDPVTGKCRVTPPCTIGHDETCNADADFSGYEGTCTADRYCVCKAGFTASAETGACTKIFEPTQPITCVTDDDCCLAVGDCGMLLMVTRTEQVEYQAYLTRTSLRGWPCPACGAPAVDLMCVNGYCAGWKSSAGYSLGSAHCGRLFRTAVSAASAAEASASYAPASATSSSSADAGAADAATPDAGAQDAATFPPPVQSTVWSCMQQ
jgi:hypothetical protein